MARSEVAELQLGGGASGALVPVDHRAGRVAGPVRAPGLALAERELDRDEGPAQVVGSKSDPLLGLFEELFTIDAGLAQTRSELTSSFVAVDLAPSCVDQHSTTRPCLAGQELFPAKEGLPNVGRQGPDPRLVRLVPIETYDADVQVQVPPLEIQRENLAALYTVVATCIAHELDPFAYLTDVLMRLDSTSADRIDEILPQNWAARPP